MSAKKGVSYFGAAHSSRLAETVICQDLNRILLSYLRIVRGAKSLVSLIYLVIMSTFFFSGHDSVELNKTNLCNTCRPSIWVTLISSICSFIHLRKGEVEICHEPTTRHYESRSLYAL